MSQHVGGARFPPSTDRIPASGTILAGLAKCLVWLWTEHGIHAFSMFSTANTQLMLQLINTEMLQKPAFSLLPTFRAIKTRVTISYHTCCGCFRFQDTYRAPRHQYAETPDTTTKEKRYCRKPRWRSETQTCGMPGAKAWTQRDRNTRTSRDTENL